MFLVSVRLESVPHPDTGDSLARINVYPDSCCSIGTMAQPSLVDRAIVALFKGVNKLVPWHRLPSWLGVFNLLALRIELRAKNLYDVYPSAESQGTKAADPMPNAQCLIARNSDGKFNSLEQPLIGCADMRFGRNVPRQFTVAPTEEELMTPNPRIISERLLARQSGKFKPATIVNLLAAAWIQFQVHDWASHYDVCTLISRL
jgi:hypothetical protein